MKLKSWWRIVSVLLAVVMLMSIAGIAEITPDENVNIAVDIDEGIDLSAQVKPLVDDVDIDLEGIDSNLAEPTLDVTEELNEENATSKIALGVGEKYALDTSKLGKNLKFTSSNTKVATVSGKGVIKAVKKGSTNIICKSGTKQVGKWTVTVSGAPKSVKLNKSDVWVNIGDKVQLKAELPKNTASQIQWTTDAKKVATVDAKGLVKAVGVGTAKITAKTFNGKKAQCVVTVCNPKDFVVENGVLVKYNGAGGNVLVPAKDSNGNKVQKIGGEAFKGCTAVKSIAIPDTVTRIEDGDYPSDSAPFGAFSYCTGLKRIALPDSMTYIGQYAFYGCTGLKSIAVPKKVARIETGTFYGCTGLKGVDLPANLTEIGWYAFMRCEKLESLTIPKKVKKIEWGAFQECGKLKSINIPKGVAYIDEGLFYRCSALQSVSIPSSVTRIGEAAFYGCSSLKSLTIPKGVREISGYAFYECSKLQSVKLPDSVEEIGYDAFANCTGLESVKLSANLVGIEPEAFYNCRALKSITIPNKATAVGYGAFCGCSSLKSVKLSASITRIGGQAFDGCTSLESVVIPSSVAEIGDGAFSGCSNLKSVKIPASVTYIGYDAFSGCSKLTASVKEGSYAEQYCIENDIPYTNY